MESLPQNIVQPLQLLIYVSTTLLIITGVFLIKLLLDASNLLKSMQDFVTVTQSELEPAIKEISNTLTNITNISSKINIQLACINNGLEKSGRIFSEVSGKAGKNLKVLGEKAKEGLFTLKDMLFNK